MNAITVLYRGDEWSKWSYKGYEVFETSCGRAGCYWESSYLGRTQDEAIACIDKAFSKKLSQEMLTSKWKDICEACTSEGSDPYTAWLAFLSNYKLINTWTVRSSLDSDNFIDELIGKINNSSSVKIFKDPSCEGCDFLGFLEFNV